MPIDPYIDQIEPISYAFCSFVQDLIPTVPVNLSLAGKNPEAPFVDVTFIDDPAMMYMGNGFDEYGAAIYPANDFNIRVQVDIYTKYDDGPQAGFNIAVPLYKGLQRVIIPCDGVAMLTCRAFTRVGFPRYEDRRLMRTIQQYILSGTE
jgi:hypothetical protein